MGHSPNQLFKGAYTGDYAGEYYRAYEGGYSESRLRLIHPFLFNVPFAFPFDSPLRL